MNPIVHSENSMRKFGGKTEDDFNKFLVLHKKMDCSKAYFSDNRHRALTHHMFWIEEVMLPIFGDFIVLDSNKKISIKDICEQHILEDFRMKFIPNISDYLAEMEMKDWMANGKGIPESSKKLYPILPPIKVEEKIVINIIPTLPSSPPPPPPPYPYNEQNLILD